MKVTYQQLIQATATGALTRFFSCTLAIKAWKSNRKTAAVCDEELKIFQTKRDELIQKHQGIPNTNSSIDFPTADAAKAFETEWNALVAEEIDIPGEPVKLDDILSGELQQVDFANLAPFLGDE